MRSTAKRKGGLEVAVVEEMHQKPAKTSPESPPNRKPRARRTSSRHDGADQSSTVPQTSPTEAALVATEPPRETENPDEHASDLPEQPKPKTAIKKAPWDPYQRYRSAAHSYPDYKPNPDTMGTSLVKKLNRMQQPVNTLNRDPNSSNGRFRTNAEVYRESPAKRQKTSPIIKSRYFTTSKPAPSRDDIVLLKDSQDGTSDRRSVSSGGKAHVVGSTQSEYRQVESKVHESSKKKRHRKRGSLRFRQSQEPPSSVSLSHSGEGPAGEASSGKVSSPPESPDALAVDDEPSPVRIVSDIVTSPRPGKRPRNPAFGHVPEGPSSKRRKPDPVESIEVSEDELQGSRDGHRRQTNFSSLQAQSKERKNRHHQRGDIQQTDFKAAVERTNGTNQSRLPIRRAVSGSHYFEDNDLQNCLFLNTSAWPLLFLEQTQGKPKGERSLKFDVSKVRTVRHHISDCPHVAIVGPASLEASGKISIEFSDLSSAKRFVRDLDPNQREDTNSEKLERILHRSLEQAKQHQQENPHVSRSHRGRFHEDGDQDYLARADGVDGPRRTGIKDKMIKEEHRRRSSRMRPPEEETADVALPESRERTQRRTRRSSLESSSHAEERQPGWSATHPGWDKDWEISLVFPATGKNRTTVDKDDIPRLDEGEFLNDNLINFYLRYLQTKVEETRPEVLQRVHIFSTFFYEKLRSTRLHINYEGVKNWTAKFDLFSYDYIVVPVNESAHWYLAIICNVPAALAGVQAHSSQKEDRIEIKDDPADSSPEVVAVGKELSSVSLYDEFEAKESKTSPPAATSRSSPVAERPRASTTSPSSKKKKKRLSGAALQKFDPNQPKIITLDSLGMAHPPTCKCLREYLVEEAQNKKNTELAVVPNGLTAKGIPEQDNYCDCGVFVLGYMEEFLKDPDETVRKLLQKEEIQWDMSPSKIRNDLRDLIFGLQKEHQAQVNLEKEQKKKNRKQKPSDKELASKQSSPVKSPLADVPAPTEAEDQATESKDEEQSALRESGSPDLSTPVKDQKKGRPNGTSPPLIEKLKASSGSEADTGAETFYSAQSSPKNGDDDANEESSEEVVAQSIQEAVKQEKEIRQRYPSPAFVRPLSSPPRRAAAIDRDRKLTQYGQGRPKPRKLLSQSMRGGSPKKKRPGASDEVVLVDSIED